jgi:hypothetical protein
MGRLDVSQPHVPPRPVTEITLLPFFPLPFEFTGCHCFFFYSCCESVTSCIFYVLMVPVAVFARQRSRETDLFATCLADLAGGASDSSALTDIKFKFLSFEFFSLAVRCATFAFGSSSRLSNISAGLLFAISEGLQFLV